MYIKQNISILFYLKGRKITSDKKASIYVRLTIDGLKAELSTGIKVNPEHWDTKRKVILPIAPGHKSHNKTIGQIRTDLERHIDLVKARNEIATPGLVIESYKALVRGNRIKEEELSNLQFSDVLDELIEDFFRYCDRRQKAYKDGKIPHPLRSELLQKEKVELDKRIEAIAVRGNVIFDNKKWEKTLLLAINEQLLHFLQLVATDHRSPSTLEKMWGRKKRCLDFLEYRYRTIDIPLNKLDLKFLDQFKTFNLVQCEISENSATRYVQALKETVIRCVFNGWLTVNMFDTYKCRYDEPHHDWLTMQELIKLMETEFSDPKLNVIRDIYVFCSFTGLSYAEVRSLAAVDIITGIDNEKWINKDRQKTGRDETLPLLPIPLKLVEKYRKHPVSIKRNKLFPVPSNQEYNRKLKVHRYFDRY